MPEVVDDLPAGARRLRQKAAGFAASIVNGIVVLRDGESTGAFPGRLLRSPLAQSASTSLTPAMPPGPGGLR
jgi:N-acyl-D-aspartate/D-glutamate deacylase